MPNLIYVVHIRDQVTCVIRGFVCTIIEPYNVWSI